MNITLNDLLDLRPSGHSRSQIEQMIIFRSGLTRYGQMLTAIRELWGRYNSVLGGLYRLEELKLDLTDLELEPPTQRRQLKIERKRLEIKSAERQVLECAREFAEFYILARKLKQLVGDLSEAQVQVEEERLLFAQAREQVIMAHFEQRPLNGITWQLIRSFRSELRQELFALVGMVAEEAAEWLAEGDDVVRVVGYELDQVAELAPRVPALVWENREYCNVSPLDASDGRAALQDVAHARSTLHYHENGRGGPSSH